MDIRHYFEPIEFNNFSEKQPSNWKYSIGSLIEKNTTSFNPVKFEQVEIALLAFPFDSREPEANLTEVPDNIREEFYALAKPADKINIVDFGNLKPAVSLKGNYQAVRDIVEYFSELNITTLVLGGSQDLSVGICEAFKSNPYFSFSTIDAFMDIKKGKEQFNATNYLSRVFKTVPEMFQFNLIGYQGHFISDDLLAKAIGINTHLRLGQLREDLTMVEPVMRNTDFLSFDIGAIKYSEAPGGNKLTPNGLRSEEACQLARYAGLSKRLKVFGMFDMQLSKDGLNLGNKLTAQILWYFIDGFAGRKHLEYNLDDNKMIYQVDIKNVTTPLVFLKNKQTEQWWMQFTIANNKTLVLGCTEDDYRQASNNEIPELWLRYVQKIDELLK